MKDQKKILFIIDHLKGGGAEIMTLNLAKKLQERGYEINIITLININNCWWKVINRQKIRI